MFISPQITIVNLLSESIVKYLHVYYKKKDKSYVEVLLTSSNDELFSRHFQTFSRDYNIARL